MKSCIYKGQVRHKRLTPVSNGFCYTVHMMYVDLSELDQLFDGYWLWSARRPAPARFRRADHYGSAEQPLDEAIRDLVEKESGERPVGSVCLLTNFRLFGYCFNPISVYYCHDADGDLSHVVLEVSNTPWGEMHCYVLDAREQRNQQSFSFEFNKDFHVSPFMPLDMRYHCRATRPGDSLFLQLDNWKDDKKVFTSNMAFERREISSLSLAATLARDPLLTLRVQWLIHWQALKLWLKKTPFYPHPAKA